MIVRDEMHIVREALDTVAPHIDSWVIVDTGSSDSTADTITAYMAGAGIPGELRERPWRDFGSNRTEAVGLCRGRADYIWVFDADDVVAGDLDLAGLSADSYLLRHREYRRGEERRSWHKRLLRDGLGWRFDGIVGEEAVCADPTTERRLPGEYWIDVRRAGYRCRTAGARERETELLLAAVDRDPADASSAFNVAELHYEAGNHAQASECYRRRAEMSEGDEESFISLLRRGECLTALGEPWEKVIAAYLKAWSARPARAEPLYEIAHHYRLAGEFELGYLFAERASEIPIPDGDRLQVAADVYGWRAADERALCAYYTGRVEESFDLWRSLLERGGLPESERARVETNSGFCVPQLLELRAEHPSETIATLAVRQRMDDLDGDVTVTITSCRRLALFERTVNSFLQCCTDLDRVGRWLCVDNGSSDADRAWMRQRYPFIEFIETESPAAGLVDSLNLLQQAVTSKFWLHLEDDWQFFWKGPYIERATEILDDDPTVAQVAFNRNYAEALEGPATGGEVKHTGSGGLRYLLHTTGSTEGAGTVAHWPHFTLRPSLMRTDAIRSVGRFAPGSKHFELEFGERYTAAGMKTAFVDAINCLHTGRLASGDDGDTGRPSAFELVDGGMRPERPTPREPPLTLDHAGISVINLDRRPDRLAAFLDAVSRSAGPQFADRCRRFGAVDGTTLSRSPEIDHLFGSNDFGLRRGVVGCALSHLAIWRIVSQLPEDTIELVFEDDVRPCDRFDRRLGDLLQTLPGAQVDFDIVLLGYFREEAGSPEHTDAAQIRPIRWEGYRGGLYAYLLSKRGARRLLALAERDGIRHAIDGFVMTHRTELNILECEPPLVDSQLALSGTEVDSDVQHDFEPVRSVTPRAQPSDREIAIHSGLGWENWHPSDISTGGLGGMETAAYRVAESLAALGHHVSIYGECHEGAAGDVALRNWRTFDPAASRLAVICVRTPEIFDEPVNADRKLLWLHDSDLGDRLTPERVDAVDHILCLSPWHRSHLALRYPFAERKLHMVRNGLTPGYFTAEPAAARERRVLYTSAPDRGLDIVLEAWPYVRERVPDAQLAFTYVSVYDRIADRRPLLRAHRERVRSLAAQPGVQSLDGLAQKNLAELMRSSLVWVHPSFSSPHGVRWVETSCIGAMEAQAAGCWVVAANWGALPDTVRVGALIDGDPRTGRFREQFAIAIVAGLTDVAVQRRVQTEGPRIALEWDWDEVASSFNALIERAPAPGRA